VLVPFWFDVVANRLVVGKIARQIRAERGLPLTEVVRVTLHDEAGNVVWKGEVR
jgi:hypothetical protein